jgi:large subunit ribosomal protein L18
MAKKNKRTIPYRRKRENKTNYKKRLALLKSKKLRLIIRMSNKNIIMQLIEYKPAGDIVISTSSSNELEKKYGWNFNRGSITSAYLVGLILGKKSKGNEAILDSGLCVMIEGSRIYGALKGAVDGGLKVPCDKEVFPKEDRISGKHIADYAKSLKANEEKYKKQFSSCLKKNIKPEDFEKYFKDTKEKILKG